MARVPWSLCLVLVGGRASAAKASDPHEVLPKAWEAMADNRAKDAFILLHGTEPGGSRERELARATALLDTQPVTDEQLHEAEAIFVRLATGDDEVAQLGAYLQARLYQVHYPARDFPRAAELYRAVAKRWPESHWGQLALVKAGILGLYVVPENEKPRARIAEAGVLLMRIKEPALRRDLQFQMGRAGTFYELRPEEVLPYFEAADAIGGLGALTQQDLTAELGELSFRAGRWREARKYFKRYLVQYPDARIYTVEQKLKVIDAKLGAEKEAGQ